MSIQLQGKIQAMPQGEGAWAASNHLQSGYKAWTWGEVAQELINYGRKYGLVISSTSKFKTREVRHAPRPPSLNRTERASLPVKPGRRNIDHKRNGLWLLWASKGYSVRLDGWTNNS